MQTNNTFQKDLENSIEKQKLNRKQMRYIYGGASSGKRSKAPRYVASRKIKPMPENWQGWRNWEQELKKRKKVS